MVPRTKPTTLTELATGLRRARRDVQVRRMAAVGGQGDLATAHRSLLRAMEAYVSELTARRLPIPRRLRDDLRLQGTLVRQSARFDRG